MDRRTRRERRGRGPAPRERAQVIRERVSALQAARAYGLQPDRGGYVRCPFHAGDRHPSLKLYEGARGWYCFGCGAGGSVIDLVMRLFGLSFAQACLRLEADFGLGLETPRTPPAAAAAERAQQAARAARYRQAAEEHRYWRQVQQAFAPPPGAAAGELHPLYVQALVRLPALEAWLDEELGR